MAVDSLAEMKHKDFAELVGESFEVAAEEDGAPVSQLKLASAAELSQPAQPNGRIPFLLTFEGPAGFPLDQGTYWFKRSDFGPLGIFIVPVAESGNTRSYEAIFS